MIGLITLLFCLLWFAVATTTGSAFIFSTIESYLSDQLQIKAVSGTITGPLVITGLHFHSPTIDVSLQTIELDWLPGDLLSQRRIQIVDLRLQGLQVMLLEDGSRPEATSTPGLPDALTLPIPVHVTSFALNDAAVTSGSLHDGTFHDGTAHHGTAHHGTADDSGSSGDLLRIQSLQAVKFSWNADGLHTPQISAASSPLAINGSVRVKPDGQWPLALNARYFLDLTQQNLPDASGTIAVTGTLAQLSLAQTVNEPYSLHLDAKISDPLTKPHWQASLAAAKPALEAFDKNLPAVGLEVTISAEGDQTQATIEAGVQVQNASVQIEGKVDFGETFSDAPVVDLQLDWQQLVWPLDATDDYLLGSDAGSAQLTGALDAYQTTVSAMVSVPAYPAGRLNVTGTGSQHSFILERLTLLTLGGEILGSASVDWLDQIEATFDLSAEKINPAGLAAQWPGQLNFTTKGEAAFDTSGQLKLLRGKMNLDGMLRGESVTARFIGDFDENGLAIASLVVDALGSTLNAAGKLSTTSQPLDFQWQLSMNDLGFWLTGLTGIVEAEGRLTGTYKDPRIRASMTAKDIATAQVQLGYAHVTTDLGFGTAPLSINANLEGVTLGETQVGHLEFDLSGTLASHVLGLRTKSDTGTNRMTVSGAFLNLPVDVTEAPIEAWRNANWQFSLDALDVNEGDIAIDLIKDNESESRGRVDSESIAISDTCFSVSDHRRQASQTSIIRQKVCAQATGSYADEFNSKITLNNLPLMILNPILPAGMGLTGSLSGDVSLGWNVATSAPNAVLAMTTTASDLRSTNSQGDVKTLLAFKPGTLSANWINDALVAAIDLPLPGSAGLNATASVAPGNGGEFFDRAIDSKVVARFDDLDWLADFVQGVTQLSGQLESNLQVSGTLSGPVLDGNVLLKNGRAVLPGPGLTLREIDLDITGAGKDGLALRGNVKSGGGSLSLQGQLNNFGDNMTGQISLVGQKVLILNTPEAEIYASPTIDAVIKQTQLELAGKVSIDSANIQLASLPQTAASVSSDQIIVVTDAPIEDQATQFDVTTRLQLLLNEAVSFSGFGLEATFGGDLNLIDLPGKPITANGDITVLEGHYRAYGQNLKIETGKLIFVGGPIDQPGIDVRAVRQVTPDIKVGALARGKLSAPEFAIFSEPPMNQSDQLAYLVLGRPLSTSSSGESSVLSRAALAMGIKGGNYLTEQFGDKLGVDRIGIETPGSNANEQAALVVGKYLSPKLFVSYGIGILDAVSTLKIEYLLSSQWRLTSESSVDQGGLDLTYVVER